MSARVRWRDTLARHVRRRSAAAAWGLGLALAGAASSAPAQGLRHDPFVRPTARAAASAASSASAAIYTGSTAAVEPAPWQPVLRGVVLAGSASMVNVDGSVVGLGESIDGWRLVRVEDGRATFVNGRRQTILSMLNQGPPRP